MSYTETVEANGHGAFFVPRRVIHNLTLVGKVPSVCGPTSRRSPRQRTAAHGGHFAMEKACSHCHTVKPLSEFGKNSATLDGLHYECRVCARAIALRAYYKNRDKRIADNRLWKLSNPEKVRQSRRNYQSANRSAIAERMRGWRRKNRERLKKYQAKWIADNPETVAAYQEGYRERRKRVARAWALANPARVRARLHRRRSRERNSEGSFTADEWKALCEKYGNRCLACGRDGKLTVDHVVPVAAGGKSTIENIQPLCFRCNRQKGVRVIDYRT